MILDDRAQEAAEAPSGRDLLLTVIDIRKVLNQLGIPEEKCPQEWMRQPEAEG